MMRVLRQRRDRHAIVIEPRVRRLSVIRWIYFISVLTLAILLVNFFFGGLFSLQSDGLVVGEPGVVAAEFPVTVRDLLVHQGEFVKKGQIAAMVSSQSVTETIARLTSDMAAREARRGELRIRGAVIKASLSLAQNRQKIATSARKELETLLSSGYLALNQRTAAVNMEYQSYQDFESLKAEKPVVVDELHALTAALSDAEQALGDLRKLYDGGRLRVPMDGVISRVMANKGSVVRAGEPLMELYGKQRFILAYVPTGKFFDVAAGDAVKIEVGLQTFAGTITRVEPVASALPREFQRAFAPVDTQQVIRVDFAAGETPPPLFTKVSLRSSSVIPRWAEKLWMKWHL